MHSRQNVCAQGSDAGSSKTSRQSGHDSWPRMSSRRSASLRAGGGVSAGVGVSAGAPATQQPPSMCALISARGTVTPQSGHAAVAGAAGEPPSEPPSELMNI